MIAALVSAAGGCGYSSKSLYTSAYKTVSVPIFKNHTFRKELEFRLTEAIDKNIEARSPYKVVGDRKQADTVLTGEIESADETVLTGRSGINLPRETDLILTVSFTWKDARTGRVLLERKKFIRAATEIPQLGERIADAEQRAVEEAAFAIVTQMQKDF
jgi:hypothetical protein